VFDENRYFDVFVEYAKASPGDILIQITVHNRGPAAATLHVLPTIWFRNLWSWNGDTERPLLRQKGAGITASHPELGERFFACAGAKELLFTENETNHERLFGTPNRTSYVKDGINDFIVHGRKAAVNAEKQGTKASAHYELSVAAGKSATIHLRLSDVALRGASERTALQEATSTRSSRRAAGKRTSSTPRSSRPPRTRTRRA
jgi:hypothetical protein